MKKPFKDGFTIVELLVVVAIIGILAAVIIASLNAARARGRDARRIRDIQEVRNAIELYISANGHPPDLGNANCLSPEALPLGYINSPTDCTANETPSYISKWQTLESQLSPYISKLPIDPCGLKCFDPSDPNLNYGGYFTYNYEAPGALSSGSGFSSTSYLIGAQNLESKRNTSFGFTGESY